MIRVFSINQQQVYRFTRWSGKSYSIFNSLGKQVSIGALSYVISSTLGVKSPILRFQNKAEKDSFEEVADSDPLKEFECLSLLDLLFFFLLGKLVFLNVEAGESGKGLRFFFLLLFLSTSSRFLAPQFSIFLFLSKIFSSLLEKPKGFSFLFFLKSNSYAF